MGLLAAAPPALAADPNADTDTAAAVLTLTQAELLADGATAPRPVNLPDSWARRSNVRGEQGRYRLVFDLAEAPTGLWAVQVARLSTSHRVRLNGALVHQGPETQADSGRPMPFLVALPPSLLKTGRNELVFDVTYRSRGGLSAVVLGPAEVVEPVQSRAFARTVQLPRALNVAGTAVGVFMLLVWLRRRSEASMGWFGLLCLMVSLRNLGYYLYDEGHVPSAVASAAYFLLQGFTVVLFGQFAMALSGLRWTWYARALKATAVAAVVLSLSFAAAASGAQVRVWFYPWVILMSLPALALIYRLASRQPRASLLAVLGGLAVVLLGAVHDYLYQSGRTSVVDHYWLPFMTPLAFAAFSLVLVNRLVNALGEVEQLNTGLERRVLERTRALQTANAAKTRFLASASHDLRQPVVTIGLLVDLLREQLATAPQRQLVERIRAAVASLEDLLKGLLDLSRLDSGAVKPRLVRVDLQALFAGIAAHEIDAAERKGLRLRLRPTPLAVRSDAVLLEQIVRNFISNAVRYTEHGGVLVAARRRGAQVEIQVWDSGIGIAPAQQAQVFDDFVQLDNAARDRSRGLGLGLAIVKRAAGLLGHDLGLRSVPGRGSCFIVRVPLESSAPPVAAPSRAGHQPLAGWRVLLVEDEDAVREALTLRLVQWGAQVEALGSMAELRDWLDALPARRGGPAAERALDLLVTDNRLPQGNAVQVIERLRQRCGSVPALVVTGDTAPKEIALLHDMGVPVLHKPFATDALLAALQAARQAPVWAPGTVV